MKAATTDAALPPIHSPPFPNLPPSIRIQASSNLYHLDVTSLIDPDGQCYLALDVLVADILR